MPFEVLNRRAARASGVAVNVSQAKSAKAGHGLSGFFRIAPDVASEAGWDKADDLKVQILVGTDEDAGMFMLKPSPEGRTKPFKNPSGASLQLSFSAMAAGFKEPTGGTQTVDYEVVDGDTIKVTVPSLRSTKKTTSKKAA